MSPSDSQKTATMFLTITRNISSCRFCDKSPKIREGTAAWGWKDVLINELKVLFLLYELMEQTRTRRTAPHFTAITLHIHVHTCRGWPRTHDTHLGGDIHKKYRLQMQMREMWILWKKIAVFCLTKARDHSNARRLQKSEPHLNLCSVFTHHEVQDQTKWAMKGASNSTFTPPPDSNCSFQRGRENSQRQNTNEQQHKQSRKHAAQSSTQSLIGTQILRTKTVQGGPPPVMTRPILMHIPASSREQVWTTSISYWWHTTFTEQTNNNNIKPTLQNKTPEFLSNSQFPLMQHNFGQE